MRLGDGYVSKIDVSGLARGDVESVHEVTQIPVNVEAHPYSLNIDPSGSRVFVANTQATYCTVIDVATDEVHQVELGHIGGRAVAFSTDGKYALITVETVSRIIDMETLQVTRHIPVGPGPRGVVVDHKDFTVYCRNFARAFHRDPEGPDYGPNTLTMVDLKTAPLDRQEGDFAYEEIHVGYGPCSVTMFDLDTIPEQERQRRGRQAARRKGTKMAEVAFTQVQPWALVPKAYRVDRRAARDERDLYQEHFRYKRITRLPVDCPRGCSARNSAG